MHGHRLILSIAWVARCTIAVSIIVQGPAAESQIVCPAGVYLDLSGEQQEKGRNEAWESA